MTTFDPSAAWPSGSMGLLIEATYHADPDRARQRWRRWLDDDRGLDDVKWQTARVLVQALHRLSGWTSEDEVAAIREAMKPFEWTHFEGHLRNVHPLLEATAHAGVPVVMTKGGALVLSGLVDAETRLMADLDLLVALARVDDFMDAAERVDWKSKWPLTRPQFRDCLETSRHSVPLTNDDVRDVDLHTSALLLNRCPDHDDGLWARATAAPAGDVPVLVPSVTDQLVITLGHGLLANRSPMGVWVGDAIALIDSGAVDWEVFLDEIERRDLAAFAYTGLAYLERMLDRPVPGGVLKSLEPGLREPFLGELLGHVDAPHATSRAFRQSWGAAAVARATKWRSRAASPRSEIGALPCASAATEWKRAGKGGARYTIIIPQELCGRDSNLFLEVRFTGERIELPGRLSVALACFDYHVCELDQFELSDDAPDGPFGCVDRRERVIRFSVAPELIAAYSLRRLQLDLLEPDTLEPATVGIDAVEYRWCT